MMPGTVTALLVIVTALVVLVVVIRLCGWLLTRTVEEAREWCAVCGIEITEGWVLVEIVPLTAAERRAGSRMSAFYCRWHRPDDANVLAWPS